MNSLKNIRNKLKNLKQKAELREFVDKENMRQNASAKKY